MRPIPFRYIFPITSVAVAALLLFVPSWLASRERARYRVADGVGWEYVDFASLPLFTEFVKAMYLPAIAVAAPILISGIYLSQVYPIYDREIEIFCVGVVALAGFLQWYRIGWLLEGQMGYRLASANRAFSKRKRIMNSLAIAIAASLGLLGAFTAFESGGLNIGIIGVLWASFCVIGLIRWRRNQGGSAPRSTELLLR
jgi:hypothetical protein